MKKLIFLVLLLNLTSCNLFIEDGIEVEIINNSDLSVSNVKFYTTEKLAILEFDQIGPNETITDFLTMKDNETDGAYVLEYTRADGKKIHSGGGYYTNGAEIERNVVFEIKTDTTLVNFSGSRWTK